MSVKQSLLFFSVAALAVAGAASAQDRDQTFRDRDANNDGVLTQGEYGGHPGNFRSLDVNNDGVLSYEEFVRRHGREDRPTLADPFDALDRNNDGVLSMSEYGGSNVAFRRLDRNEDGRLSRAEYNNEPTKVVDPSNLRFRRLDRNNDRVLSRRESGMSYPEFRRADTNRNGVLSLSEFRNVTGSDDNGAFATLDRNNDGVISSREWQGDRAAFDRLDRNDDRVLSRAEFGNQNVGNWGGGAMQQFRALDRNGDGVLSRSESRLSSSDFNRADDDNDGVLTLKEYGNADERDRGGFLGSILGRVGEVRFRDLDVNNDGLLRPSEWRGTLGDFNNVDADRDGAVTISEYIQQ